jgi:hypothetical protein
MDTVITGEASQEKLAMASTYQREFGLVPYFRAGTKLKCSLRPSKLQTT